MFAIKLRTIVAVGLRHFAWTHQPNLGDWVNPNESPFFILLPVLPHGQASAGRAIMASIVAPAGTFGISLVCIGTSLRIALSMSRANSSAASAFGIVISMVLAGEGILVLLFHAG
jgi:hypothetical protein